MYDNSMYKKYETRSRVRSGSNAKAFDGHKVCSKKASASERISGSKLKNPTSNQFVHVQVKKNIHISLQEPTEKRKKKQITKMTDRHNQTLQVHIADDKQIGIKILEPTDSISDNLALATWGASFILANQLYKIDVSEALAISATKSDDPKSESEDPSNAGPQPPHSPILELGAGTALVGLTAALLWKRNAILTDLPQIVTGTAATVGANAAALQASNVKVHSGSLDWFKPSQLSFHIPSAGPLPDLTPTAHKFPIILAADVVYDEEHPDLLLQTVSTWLAPGRASRFVLAYVLRHAYLDVIRDLWAKFEEAGLECVEEGQTTGDESWDEMAPYEWCSWRWKE